MSCSLFIGYYLTFSAVKSLQTNGSVKNIQRIDLISFETWNYGRKYRVAPALL